MRTTVLALTMVALVGPQLAHGDGLPIPIEDSGPTGVAEPDGPSRFVSIGVGEDTLVQRIAQDGGTVARSNLIAGDYRIPAVALDGTASGLSADGSTLALINPRRGFPRETTKLLVLDTDRLRIRSRVRLEGDFSFDALSPSGATMYLIEYIDPRNPTQYQVRAYDLAVAGRDELILQGDGSRRQTVLFSARGRLSGPTWSPDGNWLLVGWPEADQWLFIRTDRNGRVVAFDAVAAQFDHRQVAGAGPTRGPFPRVAGWILPQR